MNRKILALAIVLAAIPAFTAAQSVYKWTDENGVTHFGDRQPTGKQSESVSIRTGKPSGPGTESAPMSPQQKVQQITEQEAENSKNQKARAVEKAREKQRLANCNTARTNLEIMEKNARIKITEKGEQRYLSTEEIAEKKAQFEKIAEENCGPAE